MRRLLALSLLCLTSAAALAGEITSTYTDLGEQTCRATSTDAESESITRLCQGVKDEQVYWAEGDLRTFMAFGTAPHEHCSARQTFGQFNHVSPKVEWRLDDGEPFATIHRWTVSEPEDGSKTRSWLNVTKIEQGNSCRVAIVEGSYPDANTVARHAADQLSPNFNCATDVAKVFSNAPERIEDLMTGTPCTAEDGAPSPQPLPASSQYYDVDLDKCEMTEKPDEFIFEGSWRCSGIKGYDMFFAGADARNFAGFGTEAGNNCAYLKTFNGFNSFGSPVEFRFVNGEPVAAIQRWSVVENPETPEKTITWLVVNKLFDGTSCQMHFVSGSYPDANAVARNVADTSARGFNCELDAPGYTSTVGPPDINMEPCSLQGRE